MGNTCYMNSALQALSNTPPLTNFFLECEAAIITRLGDAKPGLSRSYFRLIQDMWNKSRLPYIVPSGVLYGIRNVSKDLNTYFFILYFCIFSNIKYYSLQIINAIQKGVIN